MNIQVEVDERDLKELQGMSRRLRGGFRELLEAVAEKAARIAQEEAPAHTGQLRQSIGHEVQVRGEDIIADVVSHSPLAHLIELGFKRHFVPFAAEGGGRLRAWAEQKGINTWGLWVERPKRPEGHLIQPAVRDALDEADHLVDRLLDDL